MNIAMVVYSHYSRDARVRRYAETLARKGFRVDVICLKEDYQPKEAKISLIKYPLGRRRYGKLWYVFEYLLFFLYCLFVLNINHLSKRYKVVHIHNMPDFLVFSAIILKLTGTKVILDMHDPMPELYMSKYHTDNNCLTCLPDRQVVKWLKSLERLSIRFADKVITANEEFKSIFLSRSHLVQGETLLRNKISVILNCPDERIFKSTDNRSLKTKNRYFTLLYMGTVEERFGLDIVIEAMPGLIKQVPNIRFTIIPKIENEGEYFKNSEFRIQNSELNKYIEIRTPQPLEKIARILTQADIGIVLAKNGIFTESIFPVKLLEFIQMGVPVVATRTKILSQYFTDREICFLRQNTAKEFVKSVFRLWRNQSLRTNLARGARQYLKKYNWKNEEKKYLDLVSFMCNN